MLINLHIQYNLNLKTTHKVINNIYVKVNFKIDTVLIKFKQFLIYSYLVWLYTKITKSKLFFIKFIVKFIFIYVISKLLILHKDFS